MRRLLLGFACVGLLISSVGCQHCQSCRGGRGGRDPGGAHVFGKGHMHGQGLHARHGGAHWRPETEPAGGPAPQVAYPYYTIRGPRDFLVDNPPSIGPY